MPRVVHEHVPRVLYEHPVVEYIPLEVMSLAGGPLPPAIRGAPALVGPSLEPLSSAEAWRRATVSWPFAFPPSVASPPRSPIEDWPDLPFLALGLRVAAGIYRDRQVSFVAAAVGPVYHLFAIALRYFYKPVVDFRVYDPRGVKLAEARAVAVGDPRVRPRHDPISAVKPALETEPGPFKPDPPAQRPPGDRTGPP